MGREPECVTLGVTEETEVQKKQIHLTIIGKITVRHVLQRAQQIVKKGTCFISSKGSSAQGTWLMLRIFLH